MVRKLVLMVTAAITAAFCLTGCKKEPSDTEAQEVKTVAEYQAQAEKEITAENMDAELEKIEKAMEQELSQGK